MQNVVHLSPAPGVCSAIPCAIGRNTLTGFQRGIQSGSRVYFNDPDESMMSGWYNVRDIIDDGLDRTEDTVAVLVNNKGVSLEAYLNELTGSSPVYTPVYSIH